MSDNSTFPDVPADLLRALEKKFPDRCPSISKSIREIRHESGQRSVVDFLRIQFDKQQKGNNS
jgi:hypothetical protein